MENNEHLVLSALAGTAITFDREHLPERLKIFNWGANPTDDGDIIVDETSVAALNKQIAQDTFRRIVLDFEHQSLKGHPNFKEAPRHNAAHGDLVVVPGEGVFMTALSWTKAGVDHGADYCDLSPVAVHTKRKAKGGPVTLLGVLSAALCDNGRVHGISAFSATYSPTEIPMPEDQTIVIAGLQESLGAVTEQASALKATLEAQGQQIEAQRLLIEKLTERLDQQPAVTAASLDQVRVLAEGALKPEAMAEGRQQISALSARIDTLQKEHMIQLAVIQGKAITLDETAVSAMSAESLASHISGLGVTLPVFRRTPISDRAEVETETSGLSARINTLIATIRKETGIQRFEELWPLARERQPELFKK